MTAGFSDARVVMVIGQREQSTPGTRHSDFDWLSVPGKASAGGRPFTSV